MLRVRFKACGTASAARGGTPAVKVMYGCMHACIYESMRVYTCIILYIHI